MSEAPPNVDRDAIEAILEGLFADFERLDQRAKATLARDSTVCRGERHADQENTA
jgi:hypothetical protein